MGLMQTPAEEFHARSQARRLKLRGLDPAVIEAKIEARVAARAAKDFAKADALRAELSEMGIEVQDAPGTGKTAWKVLV
jgi:cysteinyl-tRNA synthetase